jgi:hypothetical protein
VQQRLQIEQPSAFGGGDAGERNAGDLGEHRGHVLGRDLDAPGRAGCRGRLRHVDLAGEHVCALEVLGVYGDVTSPAQLLHALVGRRVGVSATGVDPGPGARAVHEVDRLVRQEPVGEVAVRQLGGRDQRCVADVHVVVLLVAPAQPTQDRDRRGDRGLGDADRFEAPLQRGVLLDVLAVLLQRRRADQLQLAPGEGRLEQGGCVHRATLGRTGAHHRVQLVDEHHDRPVCRHHLVDDAGEPLLEVAAVPGARDHPGEVQRDHAHILELVGHVAVGHALRDALDDRRLADARVTDQHRVVLRAAGEHLEDLLDLRVPPDHRVEPALLRRRRQVAPEPVQPRGARAAARGPGCRVGAGHAAQGGLEVPDEAFEQVVEGPGSGAVLGHVHLHDGASDLDGPPSAAGPPGSPAAKVAGTARG